MSNYDKSDFDTIILHGKKMSQKEQAKRAMRTGKTPIETLKNMVREVIKIYQIKI